MNDGHNDELQSGPRPGADYTAALDALVDEGLRTRLFSGVACAVRLGGRELYRRYAGWTEPLSAERPAAAASSADAPGYPPEPVGAETLFDAASLTKPLSTAMLAALAMDSSAIDPERTVGYYLAGAGLGRTLASETARLPLGSLLNHTSGLPPIPALQAFFPDPARIDRDEAIARLLAIRPEAEVGARVAYSCTGYMILGVVLESVSGVSLGELFRREMAEPLRLPRAKFGRAEPGRTSEPAPLSGAAATELCAWRGRRVRGQVHDESAFCLGGQAGNAGLFVSLDDVERLAGLMADGGRLDGRRILSERSVARMTTDSTPGLEERRGYGYRLHDEATVDGPAWPRPTFGHTGFTGGSLFIEPGRRLVSIALTNRVYFGRDETAPRIAEFRRAFNALAWRAAGPFGAVDADIEYSTAY